MGKKLSKAALARAAEMLPQSNRILQNLIDAQDGVKNTPKPRNPHPVHGKKPKGGKRK